MVSGINITIKYQNKGSFFKIYLYLYENRQMIFIDIAMASDRIINIYQLGDTL